MVSPIGRLLELHSFDLLYLFRPSPERARLADVVILKMDEESRRALSQDPNQPWDRTVHARLLRELSTRHAKVVAFDVLFDVPAADPAADEQLAAAIREHGHVVLAANVQASKDLGHPAYSQLLHPTSLLGANAAWGVADWPPDSGNAPIIRRPLNLVEYTNFAWQTAAAFGKTPAERLAARWLNFYGPAGTLPTVSYHRALETNALPRDFFAGKAVFIGQGDLITATGQTSDRHATPLSRWGGGLSSGVEIQATAFLNLVRSEWLEKSSPGTEILLVLLAGSIFGFCLPRLRPWTATAVALTLAAAVATVTVYLTWEFHRWFPWLIISAVQIPCALGWSILTYTKRLTEEKETLERDIALAESVGSLPGLLGRNAPTTGGKTNHDATPLVSPDGVEREAQPPPIPNHRLLRRIGSGSYGEVWLARDEIGTYHAVKVVYQRSFSNTGPYEREFRGIQKFTPISRNHPGFVHILHVGRNDAEGYFFYIMELGDDRLTGQQIDPATYSQNTLAALLEGGRLSLPVCLQLGLELTAALEYLHQQQLVHRDIKPSNIIFVNRVPKFADIGLVTHIAPHGKEMTYVGTEGYMPPEGPGTVIADIYSLGKVLYQVFTGRDHLEFPSLSGTLVASGNEQTSLLNEIILKACHPEKELRYQTASQMHAALLKLSQQLKA
jgi:CHASE2 domain-containing sensor protein